VKRRGGSKGSETRRWDSSRRRRKITRRGTREEKLQMENNN
jgi:hypothetical protein